MRLPNGYGTVYNLGGKRRKPFVAKKTIGWKDNGRPIYQIIGYFAKREEALIALTEFNKRPYNIDMKNITLKELYDKWIIEKEKEDVSKSTLGGYKLAFSKAEPLYDMPFVEIKANHIQYIIDELENKWSTKRLVKILFNQLYDYASVNDLDVKKYSSFIKLGKRVQKKKREPFTEEEIKKLWENKDNIEYADLLLIYIYTGFRPKELLLIKKEDVNIKDGYIIGGIKTEAGTNRIVPIHSKIMPIIEKYMNTSGIYLINNKSGSKMLYRYYYDEFINVITKLGLNTHSPHDTRHTFATRMDNANANKLSIKRIMGHTSKDVTDKVYTHKDIKELKLAIELLD